jgi:hypothetical protein
MAGERGSRITRKCGVAYKKAVREGGRERGKKMKWEMGNEGQDER